jgi:hypothetical protein
LKFSQKQNKMCLLTYKLWLDLVSVVEEEVVVEDAVVGVATVVAEEEEEVTWAAVVVVVAVSEEEEVTATEAGAVTEGNGANLFLPGVDNMKSKRKMSAMNDM